jgi:hypothetical protein
MTVEPNEREPQPALGTTTTRPAWVTPELEKLNIWSDTLGNNVPLLGDNVFTRATLATPS